MLKKVSVNELKPGMYVANITQRGVSLHENQREGRIKDINTIKALKQRGVKELYIDTEQGLDSAAGVPLEEVDKQHEQELTSIGKEGREEEHECTFDQEWKRAEKLHSVALDLVNSAMMDAKSGKAIDITPIEDMADNFMDSVIRNQNALACLSRIRDKDNYLMEHSVNVAVLMSILGRQLELERTYLHQCVTGALLHDIGKILIPDSVLHKPGKLTDEEFALMRKHATYSRKILEKTKGFPQVAINVAAQHHERLDGNGYPKGLKGDEISYEGRMASVVDIYDAITADRVYHTGMTPSVALKRMLDWCGDHLDKQLVHTFIKAIGVYPVGSLVELHSGQAALVIEETNNTLQPIVKIIYNLKSKMYLPVRTLDLRETAVNDRVMRAIDPHDFGIAIADFLH